MSKLDNLTDFLTSLANVIRGRLGTAEPINPQDFDNKVRAVHSAGIKTGIKNALNHITDYMDMTDCTIAYCKNTSYNTAFAGEAWGRKYKFVPKEDINVTGGDRTFRRCEIGGNLGHSGYSGYSYSEVGYNKMNGYKIDFSKCTIPNQIFRYSTFTYLGEIDFSSANEMSAAFADMSKLAAIEKLIIGENVAWFHQTFDNLPKLEEIRIEGSGESGDNIVPCIKHCIDFSTCPKLSMDSIKSIISHLVDEPGDLVTSNVNREETMAPTVYFDYDALWNAFGIDYEYSGTNNDYILPLNYISFDTTTTNILDGSKWHRNKTSFEVNKGARYRIRNLSYLDGDNSIKLKVAGVSAEIYDIYDFTSTSNYDWNIAIPTEYPDIKLSIERLTDDGKSIDDLVYDKSNWSFVIK